MNNHNMALSLIDSVNTVSVIFAKGIDFDITRLDPSMKKYTYCYDAMTQSLEVGDRVVIPGSGAYSVGVVTDVHNHPQIDVNAAYDYAIITDKVNTAISAELKAKVAQASLVKEFAGTLSIAARAEFKTLGITISEG